MKIYERSDLFLKNKDAGLVKINFNTITHVESDGDYVKIMLSDKTRHHIHSTMKKILFKLKMFNAPIAQIHRSFAVNIDYINRIDGNTLYLQNNEFKISETFKENLLCKLNII